MKIIMLTVINNTQNNDKSGEETYISSIFSLVDNDDRDDEDDDCATHNDGNDDGYVNEFADNGDDAYDDGDI